MIFSNLEITSKLWIFQSKLKFNIEEEVFIKKELNSFLKQWKSHGSELKAEYIVLKSHFILFSVDNFFLKASGCSVDKLFEKIKEIGLHLNKNFFNRHYVFFETVNGEIQSLNIQEFKKKVIQEKSIEPIFIYDNSISIISELNEWKKDIESWKKKYI